MVAPVQTTTPGDVWEVLKVKLGLNDSRATTKETKALGSTWNASSLLKPCADGERTQHLLRLAGTHLARGFDVDQTIEICLMWNKNNIEPLDDDKVISTCESLAATDARNNPNRDRTNALALALPATPLFNIVDARIDTFLKSAPPPMRWVLEGLLPLGIVAALVAPGGAGKSQLLMQLCYTVATGLPLAGCWSVGEVGTVLMLCAEDSREEIHRRVHRIFQQLGVGISRVLKKQLQDRLLIRSMVGEDLLLTETDGRGEVSRTALAERLLLTAQQANNLKLIIIDPAARFRGGDENSNADATRFVQALEYLAQNTGATVLIAHHSAKSAINTGEITQSASRGASALTDGIRWQMALTPLTGTMKGYAGIHESLRNNYLEAKLVKTNYTAPHSAVLLERANDGYLQRTFVPAVTSTKPTDDWILAELLTIVNAAKVPISARQFETLYGGVNRELKISEREVRRIVELGRIRQFLDGAKGKGMSVNIAGAAWLKSQSVGSTSASAARQLPRGNAARRAKTK
jgi:hypothetical protein